MSLKTIKLILVGEAGVGKTCIAKRYIEQEYSDKAPSTVGVDFLSKNLELGGDKFVIQVWDTAGQERFRSVVNAYFKRAIGAIIVYDVTNKNTFDSLERWIKSVRDSTDSEILISIVGNKADLQEKREVSYKQGKEFAEANGLQYFETSARDDLGVDVLFESILKKIMENTPRPNPEIRASSVRSGSRLSKDKSIFNENQDQNYSKVRCCT